MSWWWIFPAFFFALWIARIVAWRAWGWGWCGPWYGAPPYAYLGPREELRQRLARGDISPEEYEKRMAHLR